MKIEVYIISYKIKNGLYTNPVAFAYAYTFTYK